MHKPQTITQGIYAAAAMLTLLTLGGCARSASGQSASRPNIGRVDVDFQYGKLTPTLWHLTGRVKMKTENYDLTGETVNVFFAGAGGGASGLTKAAADGTASTQVTAHIRQPLQGQAFDVTADHAVFTPDKSRPGGGKMEFTGRVKIVTRSGFLAEPSVSTTEQATVLLGADKAQYPQLLTGPAHITLTPAQ